MLYSFEDNGDYVYDVEWSPINPALFATVDGMGKLDLWNLNNDTEVLSLRIIIRLKMYQNFKNLSEGFAL